MLVTARHRLPPASATSTRLSGSYTFSSTPLDSPSPPRLFHLSLSCLVVSDKGKIPLLGTAQHGIRRLDSDPQPEILDPGRQEPGLCAPIPTNSVSWMVVQEG